VGTRQKELKEQSADKQQGNSKKVVGRPFKKGQSGNPNGRPKKGEAWADVARELLDSNEIEINMVMGNGKQKRLSMVADKSFRHAVIIGQINQAMQGNVQSAKELADRTEGKSKETKEITHKDTLIIE
tara:strand:+ start:125 stop:508 length:384 start_codon:yes stop_codon:yes gene_type:complete